MNREALAWAAGFFDGEGCFYVRNHRGNRKPQVSASISQIHPEVLERFQRAVGLGSIRGPMARGGNQRPVWTWEVSTFEKTQAVAALLWRWLGLVKRNQASATLTRGEPHCFGWKRCRMAGHDVRLYAWRKRKIMRCHTCANAKLKKRRAETHR